MDKSERRSREPGGNAAEEEVGEPAGQNSRGEQPVPLFMRESKEGRKGDEQDEKDEMSE